MGLTGAGVGGFGVVPGVGQHSRRNPDAGQHELELQQLRNIWPLQQAPPLDGGAGVAGLGVTGAGVVTGIVGGAGVFVGAAASNAARTVAAFSATPRTTPMGCASVGFGISEASTTWTFATPRTRSVLGSTPPTEGESSKGAVPVK